MSINQKNIKILKTATSSQWKIVSQQDDSDDGLVAQSRYQPESHPTQSSPAGQSTRHRTLRDATAFYRNDTSHFLGELQQAETQLYEKVNSAGRIDFFPPKRKTTLRTDSHHTRNKGLDEQLSDSNIAIPVPKPRKNDLKNPEPEKLIVDVNDFVESFSVFRDPAYLRDKEKKPAPEPEKKSEFDFLLEQVQQRRENNALCQTIDYASDALGHVVLEDIVESMENVTEPSVTCRNVFPIVDNTIVVDGTMQSQMSIIYGTVEDAYTCHPDIHLDNPGPHQEAEPSFPQDGIKVFHEDHGSTTPAETPTETSVEEQSVSLISESESHEHPLLQNTPHFSTVEEVTVENAEDVPEIEDKVDIVTEHHVTEEDNNLAAAEKAAKADAIVTHEDKPSQGVRKYFSPPVVVQLPEILGKFGELAGEQCDGLADYIKDKVYDGRRLITFCGMKRGVGCSTMTLLAAKGIMRHGLKTAVIDANFEFPQLNALVTGQLESEASWINILHGTVAWETLGMSPKDMPLLTVFPLAENALVNWSRYEPERLQQETNRFVSTLQEYFDLILFDCGCFDDTFEEITWGELALFQPDGVILVRNPNETPLEMLEPCCREILSGSISVLGVAENFV